MLEPGASESYTEVVREEHLASALTPGAGGAAEGPSAAAAHSGATASGGAAACGAAAAPAEA